jgi:nitronate monooxygenase
MFLTEDIAVQVGTFALVPQIVDAVAVPVIAAGGIADARGIAAAFALGAAGVQIGSAFMHCPEAKISAMHRAALKSAGDAGTALTNLMTGRPARGIFNHVMRELGPMGEAPEFPLAAGALARCASRPGGGIWRVLANVVQPGGRTRSPVPAGELTKTLAAEAGRS